MPDNDLCETSQPTQQSVLNRSGKDKFILILNLPLMLRRLGKTDPKLNLDSLQISVYGSVVPNIQVPAVEVPYGGQTINVSSHARPNYAPLNVSYVIDNEFKNYWILWKWLALLNDPQLSKYTGAPLRELKKLTDIESGTLNEYQANLSLISLNEYNQPIIEFTYYNAFITNLGGITYNYRDPEIIESTAEFQFSQFDVSFPS
jgi:hypothetical protein